MGLLYRARRFTARRHGSDENRVFCPPLSPPGPLRTRPEDVIQPGLPGTLLESLAMALGWRDRRLLARVIQTTERIAATS